MGNPPWDNIQVADREFFRYRSPGIAKAQTADVRAKMIAKLGEERSPLWEEYEVVLRDCEGLGKFLRGSGDYPLTIKGDMNYYPFFIERSLLLIREAGALGMVVPTGVVTDFGNKELVRVLLERGWLRRVEDFENKGVFPDVDSRFKFCLVAIVKQGSDSKCRFIFWMQGLGGLKEVDNPARRFEGCQQRGL